MRLAVFSLVALLAACDTASTSSVQETQDLGYGVYASGMPYAEFEYTTYPESLGLQRRTNWCWAATTQMVLNWHHLYVTQEQIVAKEFGVTLPDQPATQGQIIDAMNGITGYTSDGRLVTVAAAAMPANDALIINQLHYRNPLQIGYAGHARVLTAVTWANNPYTGAPTIISANIRDPWPGSPSNQWVSWPQIVAQNPVITAIVVQ